MSKHPNRIYPWEKWFSKKKFTLRKGKDFTCLIHGMVAQIRHYARRNQVSVSISTTSDSIEVMVMPINNGGLK